MSSAVGGYWWQCENQSRHKVHFRSVAPKGIVQFMMDLADSGWDQGLLVKACESHGPRRITYDFPRTHDPVRLTVRHIVGLCHSSDHAYLPMMWVAVPHGSEPWIDFKYVGRNPKTKRLQAYGLARPAIFSRTDLKRLFDLYRRLIGEDPVD